MARRNIQGRKKGKNTIQNVRVVDKDEGTDDVVVQRLLQAYNVSEGQVRVVCGVRQEITPSTTATGGVVSFTDLVGSDDFTSFSAQYVEFRVRAIRFDVYNINPAGQPVINYWATYHADDTTVGSSAENVMDRPDARAIAPGDGKTSLAWLAHGPLEMEFQATTAYARLGGLVFNLQAVSTTTVPIYTVMAKFIVDFRGRI